MPEDIDRSIIYLPGNTSSEKRPLAFLPFPGEATDLQALRCRIPYHITNGRDSVVAQQLINLLRQTNTLSMRIRYPHVLSSHLKQNRQPSASTSPTLRFVQGAATQPIKASASALFTTIVGALFTAITDHVLLLLGIQASPHGQSPAIDLNPQCSEANVLVLALATDNPLCNTTSTLIVHVLRQAAPCQAAPRQAVSSLTHCLTELNELSRGFINRRRVSKDRAMIQPPLHRQMALEQIKRTTVRNVILVLERALSTMDPIRIVGKNNITDRCKIMGKINGTEHIFPQSWVQITTRHLPNANHQRSPTLRPQLQETGHRLAGEEDYQHPI